MKVIPFFQTRTHQRKYGTSRENVTCLLHDQALVRYRVQPAWPACLFAGILDCRYADKAGRRRSGYLRQARVGYRGKIFTLLKFRSMTVTAEADGRPQLCKKNDKRLTKVGRFLREHHLDELPQLWNVLRGEMSFVGPRPEREFFVKQISAINPDYELLYQLRPRAVLRSYALQWLYRHDGKDVGTFAHGPLLPEQPFARG